VAISDVTILCPKRLATNMRPGSLEKVSEHTTDLAFNAGLKKRGDTP
jgi:hypothetical protein